MSYSYVTLFLLVLKWWRFHFKIFKILLLFRRVFSHFHFIFAGFIVFFSQFICPMYLNMSKNQILFKFQDIFNVFSQFHSFFAIF